MREEVPGWQRIETAPPDERILVFTPRWGAIVAELSSEFGEWLSRMQCPVSLKGNDELPTHWMSLPRAPEGIKPFQGMARPRPMHDQRKLSTYM